MNKRNIISYVTTHLATVFLIVVFLLLLIYAAYVAWLDKSFVITKNGIFLQNQGTYARGQIIVTFNVTYPNEDINVLTTFNLPFQLIQSESSGTITVYQVDVPPGDEQKWIDKFQGVSGVVSAQYVYLK